MLYTNTYLCKHPCIRRVARCAFVNKNILARGPAPVASLDPYALMLRDKV